MTANLLVTPTCLPVTLCRSTAQQLKLAISWCRRTPIGVIRFGLSLRSRSERIVEYDSYYRIYCMLTGVVYLVRERIAKGLGKVSCDKLPSGTWLPFGFVLTQTLYVITT